MNAGGQSPAVDAAGGLGGIDAGDATESGQGGQAVMESVVTMDAMSVGTEEIRRMDVSVSSLDGAGRLRARLPGSSKAGLACPPDTWTFDACRSEEPVHEAPLLVVLGAALGQLDRAVAVLDASGRLRFSNRAAERLIMAGDALNVRQERVVFRDNVAHACLERYLRRQTENETGAEYVIEARRPGTESALRVVVTAVSVGVMTWFILVIFDPCGNRQVSMTTLRTLYRLTAAESLLVSRLYAGCSLAESAQCLRITSNTARSHLKRVFEKCGVHSQAALLQLLALGPAGR